MSEQDEKDHTELMNSVGGGWQKANGLRIVRAVSGEVVGELEIGPQHHQSYGIVHGGVHCAVIETLASMGAAIDAAAQGKAVVGLENHTSFIRAVRSGTLRYYYPGDGTHAPSASKGDFVKVLPRRR